MKKYIFGCVAAVGLMFSACSDFLDIPTENSSPVVGMDYSNPDNLFLPLSAAYASMRNNDAHAFPYFSMFEIASDNADKGSSPEDAPPVLAIDSIQFDPSNYLFNNLWVAYFNIVSASNYAIESMDKFIAALPQESDKQLAKEYQGEAKFIRAYAYFNLTRVFGRVPLVDKSYSATELSNLPQESTIDLYEFILQDLSEAISVLPTAYSNKYPGRTTSYTAMSMKAKVHMYNASILKDAGKPYQAQWDSVASLTDKVIGAKVYDLLPVFSTYFSLAGKNSKESIFEIQCSTLGNTSGGEEMKAFLEYAYQQGPRGNSPGNMQGWGFCVPSNDLIKFYTARNEKIRPATTLLYRGTKTPEGDSIKSSCENPVYNGKVYTPSYENNWAFNGYGFDQNIRILRYADVLLMYCEALFNGAPVGSTSGMSALDAINKVRQRADLPSVGSLSNDVIWDERRAELAMEEDRFFDLIRTGQAANVFSKLGIKFTTGKNNVYPIPSTQIALNKKLTQNPMYP